MSFFAIPGGAFTLSVTASALATKKQLPARNVRDASENEPINTNGALIGRQIRISVASGGNPTAFKWGRSAGMTAVTTSDGGYDFLMLPGAIETHNIPVDATHIDCIATTGTATAYCEVGSERP